MKKSLTLLGLGGLILSLMGFFACSKEKTPSGPSKLMYVHGLIGAPLTTVAIEDSVYTKLMAGFGNVSAYQDINGGSQNFQLLVTATLSELASRSFSISGGRYYSLLSAGDLNQPELVLVEDDLSVGDSTKAYIRIINLIPNSSQMKLSLTAGAELASSVSFKSASAFAAVQPGKSDFTVLSGSTQVVAPTLNLIANKKYSLLMTGLVNQTPKASFNIFVHAK